MIVQNQIGGGGLSNAELAEATATADQVFKGKTFFAGNDILKTGAFDLSLANATAAQVLSGRKFYAGNSTLKTGTLVPSGKIKTGSFYSFDEIDATLTIECGFKPLMVVIDGDLTGNSSNGPSLTYCYTDANGNFVSETIYKEAYYEMEQVFRNVVTQTSSGFIVKNVSVGYEGLFYYNRNYYYYAVG